MDPGSRFLQHVWKRQFFTSTKAFQKEGRHAGQGRDVKEANVCGCGRGGSLRFVPLHSSLTASQWCYETPSPPCCYHHSHQGKKIVYFLNVFSILLFPFLIFSHFLSSFYIFSPCGIFPYYFYITIFLNLLMCWHKEDNCNLLLNLCNIEIHFCEASYLKHFKSP